MKTKIFQYTDGITIQGNIRAGLGNERGTCALDPDGQRELLEWFRTNKPQLCKDIFLEVHELLW